MSFRPTLFVPALLALALGLAHPPAALAGDSPVANQIKVKLQVSPPCVQPGGLVHVSIQPDSPQMISSFFDVFVDIDPAFRPAFFDIFYGDDARIHSFFDVFCELDLQPGQTSPTTRKFSLVCGCLTRSSIELLMQMEMPAAGGGGGAGGGMMVLQSRGMRLATCPVMLMDATSPIGHVLGSGQGISSFFDIFPEISLDGSGPGAAPRGRRISSFFDIFTEIGRKAGDAEMHALAALIRESPTRRTLAADLLRRLLADLELQLMLDLKTRH